MPGRPSKLTGKEEMDKRALSKQTGFLGYDWKRKSETQSCHVLRKEATGTRDLDSTALRTRILSTT